LTADVEARIGVLVKKELRTELSTGPAPFSVASARAA
jgi:hypothetical protein